MLALILRFCQKHFQWRVTRVWILFLDLPFPHLFYFYLVFSFSSQLSLLIYLLIFSRKWLLTLCDPMDCSLTGSSVHGIFQARVLEWIAISFSRGSSWPRNQTRVSHIAGRRFTVWATREAPYTKSNRPKEALLLIKLVDVMKFKKNDSYP